MACVHRDEDCRSAWKYVGDKLDSASGYCTICGQEFVLDEKTGKLIPGSQRLSKARKELEAAECPNYHQKS